VNGHTLGSVTVNATGQLGFRLSTDDAGAGFYAVFAYAGLSNAGVPFRLEPEYPLRPPEGGVLPQFAVPPNIALTESLYLPVVAR
jgi:hypothetical protein